MTGIIYIRVSDEKQVKGTSLDGQEKICKDYAQQKGIKIKQVFREKGESAKAADRTELIKLLEFCRRNKGKADVLVVYKLDRFARNKTDHFAIRAKLMQYGLSLHSASEPIDDSPAGKLMEGVLASIAEFDNDIRTERATNGMSAKINQGIWPWPQPTGYISDPRNKGKKKHYPDIRDDELFKIERKAWEEFMTGAYSQRDIVRSLNEWYKEAGLNKKAYPQTVQHMFTNKYYAGILHNPFTGEDVKGLHEPMVSLEEFNKVQMILQGKTI